MRRLEDLGLEVPVTRDLVLQAEQVRRFFATGGPPELRLPRA